MTGDRLPTPLPATDLPDSERKPRKMAREIDVERWKTRMRGLKRSKWNLDPWTSCFLGLCGAAGFGLLTVDTLTSREEMVLTASTLGFGGASVVSFFRHRGEASVTNRTIDEICKDIDDVVHVTNEQAEEKETSRARSRALPPRQR